MQAYRESHPGKVVIDVDNRLYHADGRYVTAGVGRDVSCLEAKQAVIVMRQTMDERFLNMQDQIKNLLRAAPVPMRTVLSPGVSKTFKAVERMLGDTSLCDRAVTEVRLLCDRLAQLALPVAGAASALT